MPILKADDTEIHYQVLGEQGPFVIMIHGLLLGNMATWYFGVASELARTHRVIVYDLRGHGMSARALKGYDLQTMVADLKQLLDFEGIGTASLVGHSYGALIGLSFARAYPERIAKLAMVEGPLPPARAMQIDQFLTMTNEEMLRMLPNSLQEAFMSRQGKKMLERLQFLVDSTDLLAKLPLEADIPDAELGELAMPVQLIYGTSSQLTDVAYRLHQKIPGAKLDWLDGGHYLPSEKPLELSQTLASFLA